MHIWSAIHTKTLCSTLKHNKSLKKLCIDLAYDETVTEDLANMLLCNTSLVVLDTCHFIHTLRDMYAMTLVHGLEIPQCMKTDRGEADIEPLVREGLEKIDEAVNFKQVYL